MLTTLTVKGMHCNACKKLIESELIDLDGVKSITVDLAGENAKIEHEQISQQVLIDKIVELGYQANLQ